MAELCAFVFPTSFLKFSIIYNFCFSGSFIMKEKQMILLMTAVSKFGTPVYTGNCYIFLTHSLNISRAYAEIALT